MQKAVIYTRYSDRAQRDVSIEQQLRACREYAERQGLEVVGMYEDRALTGTSDQRPGFQRMIADSARQEWQYVIVYALDRFARDRYDSAVYKRKLKDYGIRVLSAMENLTDDPTGVLLESVLEGLAEYYSRELAQKTARGMQDNARKCMVNGPLPAGYVNQDGKYAIYEPEAAIIREIYERANNRETIKAITDDLQSRGLRTRKGGPWARNLIHKALSNERYAGVYIYGDVRVEGGIPAIVSRELFDSVQAVLGAKPNPRSVKGQPSRRRRVRNVYLLTGKLYCGDCKSPMVGISGRSSGNGSVYHYYACKGQRSRVCDRKPVRQDQIEYAITEAIQRLVLNDDMILALADAVVAQQAQDVGGAELDNLRASLVQTRRSIKNIIDAIEQGVFSPTVQKRLLDLEAEERSLSARVDLLQQQLGRLPGRDDIIALLTMYRDGDAADKDYQASILDSFLIRAYLYDDHFDLIFTTGDAQSANVSIPLDFDLDDPPDGVKSLYKRPNGSPVDVIQTNRVQIVVIGNVFALRCAYNGISHT